ncbi:MAG: hypothetical protein NZR01_10260 [Bryobacteraceae bacterium]|nr:hypothetical protein [Bryobacteraceae bacterium]
MEAVRVRAVPIGFVLSIAAGVFQVIRHSQRINGDGVSYLQMGEAILSNHFLHGYTSYWAPLYGILAAAASRGAEWAALDRLVGVQLLNAVLYCASVLSCLYFLRELAKHFGFDGGDLRSTVIQLYGLSLLTLLVVRFGATSLLTPDVAVSALCFLAGAETVRLMRCGLSWSRALLIGLIFGVGYWMKSTLFPLAAAWLALAICMLRRRRREFLCLSASVAVWSIMAAPLVVAISKSAGRWSIGENGRLNYLWYVNRLPNRYWIGQPPEHGTPLHPMRKLLENPAVYEFGNVFPSAAYPPWYDPGYWYAGARARWSISQISSALKDNLGSMRRLWLSRYLAPFTFVMLTGFLLSGMAGIRSWAFWLVLFALAPFTLIIIHTEPRFFYGQTTTLLTVGAGLLLQTSRSTATGLSMPALLLLLSAFAWGVSFWTAGQPFYTETTAIRAALQSAGVRPGDPVCSIANTADTGSWAWYARVRVVAEMPIQEYRKASASGRLVLSEVEEAFRKAGCRAAVATLDPTDTPPSGWSQIPGAGNYYLKSLK